MAETRLDRWLALWVFILTGILFNLLPAVITHYFIGLNNGGINVIDREIESKQVLIESLWQSRIEVEREKEFFMLLLAGKPAKPNPVESYYRDHLKELMHTHDLQDFAARMQGDAGTDLELLLDLSSAAQPIDNQVDQQQLFRSTEVTGTENAAKG